MSLLNYQTQYEFDKRYVNVTINVINDGIHNTVMNVTADLYQTIENLFIDSEVRLEESPGDRNYGKIFFRSKMDGRKVLQGVRGNYLISILVDLVLKSMDFVPKLPAEKV